MITLTIIRHGESTDNLKPIWAGHADAPLSHHGMNQAKALGESYKGTKADVIVCSPLLRANWTAKQVHANLMEPKPPLEVSPLLKEQGFGVNELQPFEKNKDKILQGGRDYKPEKGESKNEVRRRAEEVIARWIEPSLQASQGKPPTSRHVIVVAHGIFNSELMGALLARRLEQNLDWKYRGMTNTGWNRLELGYLDEQYSKQMPDEIEIETSPSGPVPPTSAPPANVATKRASGSELLTMRVTHTDVTSHLANVKRQRGGIGSGGYDEKQTSLRQYFGGGGAAA